MARFGSTFPGGWPGLGLLLLRATVGITAGVQGAACFGHSDNRIFGMWAVGVLALAAGALLVIGFLTTIASFVVGLGNTCIALAWFPLFTPNEPDTRLAMFVAIMSAVIVLVGPGAFSLDSHFFGRREIIIPPLSD